MINKKKTKKNKEAPKENGNKKGKRIN